MKLFAKLFILSGILLYLFGAYLIWERNNPDRLAFKNYTGNFKSVSVPNPPVKININALNIHLPLYPAVLKSNKWQTTTQGASYLLSSPIPGDKGNSIIYAHDWASLFGPLLYSKPGQTIQIEFSDHTIKTFVITKTKIVPYTQADILSQSSDKRITLYTCTGFLDSQRFVAVAIYKSTPPLASK